MRLFINVNLIISVVIPSFNRAQSLPRALDSVLAQKPENIEIEVLLIDDGSTDDTAKIVNERYSGLTYLYQQNCGVSAARNLGIERARGDYIAFLDSDDEWLPHKLTAQINALKDNKLKVCHTEEIWIRNGVRVNQMKKHKKKGGWIYSQCLAMCAMSPSSIMIHRSVFETVGVFDESLPACEDYDLWLRICANYEVCFLTQPFIKKYGGHEDQLSRQHWGMDRFRVKSLEKMLDSDWLDKQQQTATKAMLLNKTQILLNGAIKRGNTSLAQQCRVKLTKYA